MTDVNVKLGGKILTHQNLLQNHIKTVSATTSHYISRAEVDESVQEISLRVANQDDAQKQIMKWKTEAVKKSKAFEKQMKSFEKALATSQDSTMVTRGDLDSLQAFFDTFMADYEQVKEQHLSLQSLVEMFMDNKEKEDKVPQGEVVQVSSKKEVESKITGKKRLKKKMSDNVTSHGTAKMPVEKCTPNQIRARALVARNGGPSARGGLPIADSDSFEISDSVKHSKTKRKRPPTDRYAPESPSTKKGKEEVSHNSKGSKANKKNLPKTVTQVELPPTPKRQQKKEVIHSRKKVKKTEVIHPREKVNEGGNSENITRETFKGLIGPLPKTPGRGKKCMYCIKKKLTCRKRWNRNGVMKRRCWFCRKSNRACVYMRSFQGQKNVGEKTVEKING